MLRRAAPRVPAPVRAARRAAPPSRAVHTSVYERDYAAARGEAFWADAARRLVSWERAPTVTLDRSRAPFYRWFKDGTLNTCYNALDRHVAAGAGQRVAFIYESPVTGAPPLKLTYADTLDRVARLATVLTDLGVGRGDRVVIYMPMVPEAALTMLACARIGAVHSVVFGGFAPEELAARVRHARPRVLVTASCGVEPGPRAVPYADFVRRALQLVPSDARPRHTVLYQRAVGPQAQRTPDQLDFTALLDAERRATAPVPVSADDPLYVLYTSGTTGAPKGVVRDNGGHAVALALAMERIYGVGAGEAWWAASDLGWVVGHSFIVYGPLIAGATSVLFEGKPVGTPDAATFWRIIGRHRVKALFTAPTALRAIKQADPHGALLAGALPELRASLRRVYLAGERADPPTVQWAQQMLGVPVHDHYWQTECPPICSTYYGLGDAPSFASPIGTAGRPVPGYDLHVLDPHTHEPLPAGRMGELVATLPLPPGALLSLYDDDAGFVRKYLSADQRYYITGDAAVRHADGSVEVLARTDDVINVAGHRLSTGRLEEVATGHPRVAEACAVGAADALKGHVPLILVTLKHEVGAPAARGGDSAVEAEIVEAVRTHVGAIATPRHVLVVPRLPKTRSGKILRGMLRSMVGGDAYSVSATIEDASVVAEVAALLSQRLGITIAPPKPK